MNKKNRITALVLTIALQILVLSGEYLNAVYPMWTGKEVLLKTVPRDPRSLFRGNYARLDYDISQIDGKDVSELKNIRNNERVYVKLKAGQNGIHEFNGLSSEKPDSGIFIRGRIETRRWQRRAGQLQITYGIEAYFAPKEKALVLERELRNGGIAKVMIAKNGKTSLEEVILK